MLQKKRIFQLFFITVGIIFSALSYGGPYTAQMKKACPDTWILTDKAIPVIWSSTDPWSEEADDKTQSDSHLKSVRPIITINKVPVVPNDYVEDPLTVASECLVYRNFEVDTFGYVAPPMTPLNVSTGWIPAAIF